MRLGFVSVVAWMALAVGLVQPAAAQQRGVLVFAAASMKTALDEAVAEWGRRGGAPAKVSYAASSALARQIEQGAPASVFLSADLDWMNYLQQRKLIRAESRANLLGNSIVLVAPKDSAAKGTVGPGLDLAGLLGGGRMAMGQVDSVPAGKYGKAALEKLGLWPAVADKLAQTENVRAALLLVARGETPLGIVYATDAAAEPNVRIVGTFPADSHPPIIYPVALTKDSVPEAAGFVAWLRSPEATPFFVKQGFTPLR
ncbi:molybdate transport system substrate-binding protein [Stella humosa]|uniref:Molybdate transport system substrate-binding protein n=1 Tax=Stella humosa TaxID=94 RepID=A0A3N1KZC6_9PROT|nr:molybdate ABC transporter substrate-binding protein [Stella humosa]ROP83546.1 molybdate transport system substrate-binding protein [Stella humosa]BBK33181.1 molybdate ABC transporter substrate-binding protein [Stella humosa]